MSKEIIVPDNISSPIRLDLYLVGVNLGLSRNQIQKGIRDKWIKVIGKGIKPNFILKGGEHIVLDIPPVEPLRLKAEDIPLDIIYEDSYLAVINKPPGMVVHPSRGWNSGTLVNALLYHMNNLSKGSEYTRPGIIHRLDKNTSGLLIVAKTERSHYLLAKMLAERKIERHYFAIVWGSTPSSDTINLPIGHNPKDHKQMAVNEKGKSAVTYFTTLEDFTFLSVLKLKLQTGRTHQIRVHMKQIGHPIFADPDYNGREERLNNIGFQYRSKAKQLLKLMDRQALHSWRLKFVHPFTEQEMEFVSDIPSDISTVLRELGSEFI